MCAFYQKYADQLVEGMIENPDFSTPSTIGIFAPWGSGKSRFMEFISEYCRNTECDPSVDVVVIPMP